MTRPPDPPDYSADDRETRDQADRRVNYPTPPDDRQFAPVIFDADEHRALTPPFAEYDDSGVMRVLGVVVLLAIVIAALVLPPISLLDRGDEDSGGISANPRGELPTLPAGLTAISDLYDLEVSDDLSETDGPWILTIRLSDVTVDQRNLGLYTYGSSGWLRVERAVLTQDGTFAEAEVTEIPPNIAVLRRSAFDRTLGLIIPVGEVPDPDGLDDATTLVVTATTLGLGDDGTASLTTDMDVLAYTSGAIRPAPVYLGVTAAPEAVELLNQLLGTELALSAHIDELVAAAEDVDANGIYIAYLDVDRTREAAFTRLVTQLAARLSEGGRGLIVGVPAPATADTGAYDWAALVDVAAAVWLSAPDDPSVYYEQLEGVFEAQQAAGLEFGSISLVLNRMSHLRDSGGVALVDRYEALGRATELEIGVEGGVAVGDLVVLTATNVATELGVSGLRWDQNSQTVSFSFIERSGRRTIWVENNFSLAFRLDLVRRFELGGIAVASAQTSPALPDIWDAVADFLDNGDVVLQLPYGPYLNPCWQAMDGVIEGEAGNCWSASGTAIGSATWRAPEGPGIYEVGLVVSDGEIFVGRRLALRVTEAGEPPDPIPTSTPDRRLDPTAEPTVEPAQEATAVPVEAPTAEPTTTPAPVEAPTAEPTTTPAPAEASTAEPTTTPAPSAASTAEPTSTVGAGPPGPGGNE